MKKRLGGGKKIGINKVKEYVRRFEYECLSDKYINNSTKLKFRCNKGHIWLSSWSNFKQGRRCIECSGIRKKTIREVKEYTLRYKYKCLSDEYINAITKLKFKCNIEHEFWMTWDCFQRGYRCPSCAVENRKKTNHHNWKGGVSCKYNDIPLYNTYAPQLEWCEEVRCDPENPDYLQVRCTESSCREWFRPKGKQVNNRIRSLENKGTGENRLYCSEECKQKCSIFNQKKYPKGQKPYHSRPDQSEWSQLVKERDNYTCQRCGSTENLEAHHIEGIHKNPIESADIDLGITLCHDCHKEAHKDIGCRYVDLIKNNLCEDK